MVEHRAAWSPQGELGRWVIARPAVAKLGTSLFVHGGLSSAYASVPIDDINRRVAATLAARETAPTAIINDPLGPLWYRGLTGMGAETAGIGQQLDHILAATGARRIVIGHTPLTSGVAVQQDGKLVRVDSGNSRAYGGVPGLCRNRRRHGDDARCRAAVAVNAAGARSCSRRAHRPRRSRSRRCSRSTTRSGSKSAARFRRWPRGRATGMWSRPAALVLAATSERHAIRLVAARDHPAAARNLRLPAAARRIRAAAAGRFAVRRPEAAQARHPLPPAPGFQQHLLLEYAAYRLYNLLTPAQLPRAPGDDRLCRRRAAGPMRRALGFFIEDIDDVGAAQRDALAAVRRRVSGGAARAARGGALRLVRIYDRQSRLVDAQAGRPGEGCCHNSRLLERQRPPAAPISCRSPTTSIFPGLVDAPYAVPPDEIPVATVRSAGLSRLLPPQRRGAGRGRRVPRRSATPCSPSSAASRASTSAAGARRLLISRASSTTSPPTSGRRPSPQELHRIGQAPGAGAATGGGGGGSLVSSVGSQSAM